VAAKALGAMMPSPESGRGTWRAERAGTKNPRFERERNGGENSWDLPWKNGGNIGFQRET